MITVLHRQVSFDTKHRNKLLLYVSLSFLKFTINYPTIRSTRLFSSH